MKNKIILIILTIIIAFNFTGCAGIFDAPVSLMSPPKGAGNLVEIEELLSSKHSDFEFVYPYDGDYRNAVLTNDFDNDGELEAIAFYQTDENKNITIHLCVLEYVDEDWTIKFDTALSGIGIDRIEFADICDDSSNEILVGCRLNNSNEQELNVYKVTKKGLQLLTQERYTNYYVCDLGASKKDQIAIFKLSSQSAIASQESQNTSIKNFATAKLISFSYETDSIPFSLGSVNFDPNVISISKISVSKISEDKNGIFVDANLGEGKMLTEVFYYEDTIKTVFYNKAGKNTKLTERNSLVECRDIDKDGRVEIPKTYLCNGYDDTQEYDNQVYFTEWYSLENNAITNRVKCGFLNVTDNYFVATPSNWLGSVSAKKFFDSRERVFYDWDFENQQFGEEIFRVRVFLKSNYESDDMGYKKVKTNEEYVYAVKVNKNNKGENKITVEELKENIILI